MTDPKKPARFALEGKLPHITQLNRTTIIGISAVVLIVVVLLLFSALSSAPQTVANKAPSSALAAGAVKGSTAANPAAQLPNSYEDASAINQLLNRNQPSTVIPPQVTQELANMQAQQVQLQAEIAQLKSQPQTPQNNTNMSVNNSPLTQEAMTSAIFFAGGAPTPVPTQTTAQLNAQAQAEADAKNQAAKNAANGSYQQQNMQDQKLAFLSSKPSKDIYNDNGVQYPVSKFILQAGSSIPAILKTKIESSNPGYISAVVTQNVYDSIAGQYLLIPKGSVLMGQYSSQIAYGQSTLQAKFTRLIRPDGSSIVLPNELGTDAQGVSGFEDEVNNHWGQVIGSAVLAAVFNIPAIVATNQMNSSVTCPVGQTCTASGSSLAKASALQSLGETSSQVGSQIIQRSLNLQPTIIIRAGYQFSVLVTKDIVLPPYQMPFGENIPETSGG